MKKIFLLALVCAQIGLNGMASHARKIPGLAAMAGLAWYAYILHTDFGSLGDLPQAECIEPELEKKIRDYLQPFYSEMDSLKILTSSQKGIASVFYAYVRHDKEFHYLFLSPNFIKSFKNGSNPYDYYTLLHEVGHLVHGHTYSQERTFRFKSNVALLTAAAIGFIILSKKQSWGASAIGIGAIITGLADDIHSILGQEWEADLWALARLEDKHLLALKENYEKANKDNCLKSFFDTAKNVVLQKISLARGFSAITHPYPYEKYNAILAELEKRKLL